MPEGGPPATTLIKNCSHSKTSLARLPERGEDRTGAREARGRPLSSPEAPMLLELIDDLVDPSLGADLVLVPAGRAGDADGADHVVADLDR